MPARRPALGESARRRIPAHDSFGTRWREPVPALTVAPGYPDFTTGKPELPKMGSKRPSRAVYRTDGQKSANGHAPQRGFRATHVCPAVKDHPEAERAALRGGDQAVQHVFHLDRVAPLRRRQTLEEPEAVAHAQHVRVDRQARQTERHAAHDVARLAARRRGWSRGPSGRSGRCRRNARRAPWPCRSRSSSWNGRTRWIG